MLPPPLYKVNLIAESGQHNYTIDGNSTYLPGVTGILNCISKYALLPWTAKVTAEYMAMTLKKFRKNPERLTDEFLELLVKRAKKQPSFVKEKAGREGSAAHAMFDDVLLKKREFTEAENQLTVVQSFKYWLSQEKLRIIGGDTKVASLEHGYGGSLDAIATDGSKLVIVDFKTGNNLYDSHGYQVASYAQALKETHGLTSLPAGIVVRFSKKRVQYERREIADIHRCLQGFKAALAVSRIQAHEHFVNRELCKPEKITSKKINAKETHPWPKISQVS